MVDAGGCASLRLSNASGNNRPLYLRCARRLLLRVATRCDSSGKLALGLTSGHNHRDASGKGPSESSTNRTQNRIANGAPARDHTPVALKYISDANVPGLAASENPCTLARRHRRQILNVELTAITVTCLRITTHGLPQLRTRRLNYRGNLFLHKA
jgi:hypothetical protein